MWDVVFVVVVVWVPLNSLLKEYFDILGNVLIGNS